MEHIDITHTFLWRLGVLYREGNYNLSVFNRDIIDNPSINNGVRIHTHRLCIKRVIEKAWNIHIRRI